MKQYQIIGGQQLGPETFVAQVLVDAEGQYVATMEEVIHTMEDHKRLIHRVADLLNRQTRMRNCFQELSRLIESVPE